jgi:DNA-binding winged helix-turn-helix (wHTH) protein/Tfp pilus assembly protein PilF
MTEIKSANVVATKNNKVTRYLIDDLNLDVQRGELTSNGEALTIPKLSYDLLVALAYAAPALLSQQELMQKVWPDRVIGDETLKQRVKLLRKTLGDNACDPKYIEAVRGRGYRLIPQVTSECVIKRSPSVMPDLQANDSFSNLLPSSIHRWGRRPFYICILLFSVIVSGVIITSLIYQQEAEAQLDVKIVPEISLLEKQVGKSAFNLYQRGREYYKRYRAQDNKIAIDFYRQAITEKKTFSEAYAGLSQAYSQEYFQFGGNEKSKQAAIDNAYLAISYNNNSADAYKALGTAYYVSGWLSKSINALIRAVEIAGDDREILTNLAFIYSEQGKFEQAFYLHKKTLEVAPDYAPAMLHLAITLQRTEHFELALQWYEKSFEQQPDYLLTTYHLAHLYIELNQFEKAREIIDKSLLVQPEQSL